MSKLAIYTILNLVMLPFVFYFSILRFMKSTKSLIIGFSMLLLLGILQSLISLVMILFKFNLQMSLTIVLTIFNLFLLMINFQSPAFDYVKLLKGKNSLRNSTKINDYVPILSCTLSSIFIVILAGMQWLQVGDQGWDSNAYHLPLVGIISENGLREWPLAMQSGTYTIFSPFGPHVISAIWVTLMGSLQASILTNWFFYVALCFLVLGIYEEIFEERANQVVAALLPVTLACIPSIWGQLNHFYIDLVAGTYWLGVFASIVLLVKSRMSNRNFLITVGFLAGCAVSSKTHQIYALIPIFIFSLIFVSNNVKKISNVIRSIVLLISSFAFAASSFFLRNIFEFENPLFPFRMLSWKGIISVGEVRQSFENFVPAAWPSNQIGRVIHSWVVSPISSFLDVVKMKLGLYDPNRPDLTIFTYDTVIGGLGVVLAVFISLTFCLILFKLYTTFRDSENTFYFIHKYPIYLTLIPLASSLITPGAWWSRYNLGPGIAMSLPGMFYFFRLVSSFKFNNSKIDLLLTRNLVIVFVIFSLIFSSGLLAHNFREFEVEAAGRRVTTVKPNLGLSQGVSSIFMKDCGKVAIIEPRPTFTSFVWEAECDVTTSVAKSTLPYYVSTEYDYFIATEKYCQELQETPEINAFFSFNTVRSWFDSDGTYASCIIERKKSSN